MDEGTKPVAHYEIKDTSELPIPPDPRGRYPRVSMYAELAVGPGFTVPIADLKRVRHAALQYWRAHGGLAISRKIDAETGGIWRVK